MTVAPILGLVVMVPFLRASVLKSLTSILTLRPGDFEGNGDGSLLITLPLFEPVSMFDGLTPVIRPWNSGS